MPIVAIGLSHRSAPVDVREKFAFKEPEIPAVLQDLRERGLISEGVILSTCNRVELYAVMSSGDAGALAEVRAQLATTRRCEEAFHHHFYTHGEPNSLEHLFKVACGLDSMMLGETEILGQLKKAYDLALQNKLTGGRLNKAFQRAFNVAKHLRSSTNIQRGSVSVGSAAVELAEKIFNSVDDRHVMVIGAGDTSEKTARALLSRGAKSILVANRSLERATVLASELGGRAVSFDTWMNEFAEVDIIISSTAAPHYILDKTKVEAAMRLRKNRPLLLIDIAVPRDIDPEVNFVESVYLYNIDDLQTLAENYLRQRQQEIAKCEEFIREKAAALLGHAGQSFALKPNLACGTEA